LESFKRLKQALSRAPVLRFPNFDEAFTLTTDASQVAAGAVLSQGTAEGERPVAYASKKFTPCETRYSAIERELLAIVWAVEHFRPYLWGRKFLVRTDHKPLLWVGKLKESSARVTRLKERLAPYDFDLVHTKGVQNIVADFLSRHVNAIETPDSPFNVERYADEAFGITRGNQNQRRTEESRAQEHGNVPLRPDELDDLARRTYEQDWQDGPNELQVDARPRPWDTKQDVVNTKLWQIIVREVPGRKFDAKMRRYHKQRIYQIDIGRETSEEEVAEGYNQVLKRGRLFHVYLGEERQRELLQKLYTTRKVGADVTLIECRKLVETVLDPDRQERILAAHHEGVSNHRGVGATLADLRRRYYWWNMIGSIRDHILQCEVCARAKYVRIPRERPQMLTPTARDPLDRMQVDLFQWEGSKFLVLIDEATRLAIVQKVRDKTARTMRTTLLHLFTAHGCPRTLIMDQGREFKNGLIAELLEDLGVRAHYTTPGHPRSHGMVERLQGSLTEHLQLLRLGRQMTGEEAMWRAVLAYNSSVHSGTDRVPFEEMRGLGTDGKPHPDEYIQERSAQRDHQVQRKERRVDNVNRRRPVAEDYRVRVGDKVFRKNWYKRTKEGARYTGPFTVERILPRNRAVIRGSQRESRPLVTHMNELRLPASRPRLQE
jgi:transposase InsO family protein